MPNRYSYRFLALIILLLLLLAACSRGNDDNPLIGKWEHMEPVSGISVTLEFTRDRLSFSAPGFVSARTTYSYVDEDTIKVRNLETGADEEASYTIRGDRLTITFYGEGMVEYNRVK